MNIWGFDEHCTCVDDSTEACDHCAAEALAEDRAIEDAIEDMRERRQGC